MTSLIDLRTHRPAIEPEQIADLRRRLFGGDPNVPSIPGYEVRAQLGQGAFGQVYRAFDPRFGRPVAIKVVQVDSTAARLRIEREALALARLSHPNVVQVYDKGPASDDAYFLALEYIEGPNLEQWLDEAPRTLPEILAKFLDVARGLAAAHDAGLVHRDFKPANAIVGPNGRVRVVDFGLACSLDAGPSVDGPCGRWSSVEAANDTGSAWTCEVDSGPASDTPTVLHVVSGQPGSAIPEDPQGCSHLDEGRLQLRLTRAGRFVGTPYYAAPEQYDGLADARSDQFSFFVSLYEAIYRRRPFRGRPGDSPWLPPPPTRVDFGRGPHRVPRGLRRLLRRGLAHEPAQRHPSMSVVAERLHQWVHGRAGARRMLAMAGGAAVLTAVAMSAFGMPGDDEVERCRADRDQGPAAWMVHESLVEARDSEIARSLSDYAERWTEGRQKACYETEPETRAQIEACLDQGAERLGELSGWLTTADRNAWAGLHAHPGPLPLAGLLATLPDPTLCVAGTEPRAGSEHHEAWRALLDARMALEEHATDHAAEHAEQAIKLARRLGDRSLRVAAEYQRLRIDAERGEPHQLAWVLSLLVQALDAGDRALAADIAATSMSLTATGALRPDPDSTRTMPFEDVARLTEELTTLRLAEREASGDPTATGWLRYAEGHAAMQLDDYAGARDLFRQATTLLASADPPVPAHLLAAAELNEAIALGGQEPPVLSALPMAIRALQIRRAELGPEHPAIAQETRVVGELHVRLEDFQGAIDHYEEAERIFGARDLPLDQAFTRGEIIYAHWLAAARARRRATRAEADGDDPTRHWAQFERRRHLALQETLALERHLPARLSDPQGDPRLRAADQARLWVVMLRSYIYHRGCWDESLTIGQRLERTCTTLDGNEASCVSGRRILRSMLEQDVATRRSEAKCRVDPDRLVTRSLTETDKIIASSK